MRWHRRWCTHEVAVSSPGTCCDFGPFSQQPIVGPTHCASGCGRPNNHPCRRKGQKCTVTYLSLLSSFCDLRPFSQQPTTTGPPTASGCGTPQPSFLASKEAFGSKPSFPSVTLLSFLRREKGTKMRGYLPATTCLLLGQPPGPDLEERDDAPRTEQWWSTCRS